MSFNDLERGLNERAPLARDLTHSDRTIDRDFQNLTTKVSTHIFRINSNVSGLQKLIDILGSSRDTSDIRKKLHDLTESTREFIKNSSVDAKRLASWQVSDSYKIEQQKVSRDYASSIQSFQKISRLSIERQKQFVDRVKSSNLLSTSSARSPNLINEEAESHELSETRNTQQQQQQQQQHQNHQRHGSVEEQDEEQEGSVNDYELDYQEALIQERETEIREIEVGINELNEIFRDLGTIVQEQGGNIDNIESNVHRISNDMRGAVVELNEAHEYQKKAGKKMLCLLILFIVIFAIILIAILS
ncbi:t-SNARE [Phakopsora pachyrhizi]|uniref:t-SNARE n=1 Tax=Phakopsora pachyrhizi TaxID=170000 RepID=A0AAV0BNX6_PHAPC|nr:t-SNARE [Phakopsora pachyrhizi]